MENLDYHTFLSRFQREYRMLICDLAFVDEFLSRPDIEKFQDAGIRSSIINTFFTYQDSLFLGIQRLQDKRKDVLSFENFQKIWPAAPRFSKTLEKENLISTVFENWQNDHRSWSISPASRNLTALRHEFLAHNTYASNYRSNLDELKDLPLDDGSRFSVSLYDMREHCREGVILLARLITLCGRGRNQPWYFGHEEAGRGDFERDLAEARTQFTALLDLVENQQA